MAKQPLHLALGHLDAFDQRLQSSASARVARLGRQHHQGAAQRIGRRQHVAGKAGDGVGARVGDLALGALAQIFHLGDGAQQLSLQLGILGLQRLDRIGRRCRLGGLVFGVVPWASVAAAALSSSAHRIVVHRDLGMLSLIAFAPHIGQ